jgi:hypothetical protein
MAFQSRTQDPRKPTGFGARGKIDPGFVKKRAKELDVLYNDNTHNPEDPEKLPSELINLLQQPDHPSGGDPMPGQGQMETLREQIEMIRRMIWC